MDVVVFIEKKTKKKQKKICLNKLLLQISFIFNIFIDTQKISLF